MSEQDLNHLMKDAISTLGIAIGWNSPSAEFISMPDSAVRYQGGAFEARREHLAMPSLVGRIYRVRSLPA